MITLERAHTQSEANKGVSNSTCNVRAEWKSTVNFLQACALVIGFRSTPT